MSSSVKSFVFPWVELFLPGNCFLSPTMLSSVLLFPYDCQHVWQTSSAKALKRSNMNMRWILKRCLAYKRTLRTRVVLFDLMLAMYVLLHSQIPLSFEWAPGTTTPEDSCQMFHWNEFVWLYLCPRTSRPSLLLTSLSTFSSFTNTAVWEHSNCLIFSGQSRLWVEEFYQSLWPILPVLAPKCCLHCCSRPT